jgi:hypothetical protein
MLGSDYATNTWPGCGEIDIMEYKENPCYSWNTPLSSFDELEIPLLLSNAALNHIYKLFQPHLVKIVDDKLFHSVANDNFTI